jgi:hypothetical protein
MSSSTPHILAALPWAIAPYFSGKASTILDEWAVLLQPVPALADALAWRGWVPSDPSVQLAVVRPSAAVVRLLRDASSHETIVALVSRMHPAAAPLPSATSLPESSLPYLAGWAMMATIDARVTPAARRLWKDLPTDLRELVR